MKLSHLIKTAAIILPAMTAPVAAGTFSQPAGLAVDPNTGNLYVANQLSNKVIVFDKNFAQQTNLTITAGLDQPISLAIDPAGVLGAGGVLYVGNIGVRARITTYALGSTQISTNFFAAFRPYALAIGSGHVLYDFDNATTLNIYSTTFGTVTLQSYASTGLQSSPGLGAIGLNNGVFYIGDGQRVEVFSEPQLLANKVQGNSASGPIAGSTFAMTFDNFHNAFITDPTNKAVVVRTVPGALTLIQNLSSFPSGIALDKARNRLFVSFPSLNMINVYTVTYDANNLPTGATFVKSLK